MRKAIRVIGTTAGIFLMLSGVIAWIDLPHQLTEWGALLQGVNQNVARWTVVLIGLGLVALANGAPVIAAGRRWTLKGRARALSKEILAFLAEREANAPPMPSRPETWHQDTQAMVGHMNETGILGSQKFGSRMLAMHHELVVKGLRDPQLDRFIDASVASLNAVVIQIAAERLGALAERLP